ncbi:MAG TPA: carbohydrate ABC transporter permease [Candidatus Limnocylindria bacterium]|nr:carbohydrate ABC transporter permease [Candidatus Limnocylindria bacterium]
MTDAAAVPRGRAALGTALFLLGWAAALLAAASLPLWGSRPLALGLLVLGAALIAAGLMLNPSWRMRRAAGRTLRYVLLTAGALVMVFPFYWMLSSALKTFPEMNLFPPSIAPRNWLNFANFRIAFEKAPFARYFLNSSVVLLGSVGVTTMTTILAAFAFSRLQFPGRSVLFALLLSMMMLPFEMLVITNYQTIVKSGLNDTLFALVIPFISSIFYTYILRNFFLSIPDGLYWSARVDGCTNWTYLWKVMVPIARPSLVTVVLLNALASWNSFMWPLLVIKTDVNRTLPFGLYTFTTEAGSSNELIMAASAAAVLPMVLLFLFARRQIIRGVARGGIKG